MVCLALELVGSWVELGFSMGMEAFGLVLVYYCSLESGLLRCSKVLELSLLPLVFGPSLSVALRLLSSRLETDKPKR